MLESVFDNSQIKSLISTIESAFSSTQTEVDSNDPQKTIRSQAGKIYAARNLHELIDDFDETWQRPELTSFVSEVLGADFGLVRALYFDKHPERTWSLPWHRDMTIVVKRNDLPSSEFIKPTNKAGIPHVEAPVRLLEKMLTLRVHLDPITSDNGPLIVKPKSHQIDEKDFDADRVITSNAGDVFIMRPLLLHSSPSSKAGIKAHRRIIHLEFATEKELWDEFEWRTFVPIPEASISVVHRDNG